MFSEALLALYACHPPKLLSEMLPTLALKKPKTLGFLLSSKGKKDLPTKAGPMVFILKTFLKLSADICFKLFSGEKSSP